MCLMISRWSVLAIVSEEIKDETSCTPVVRDCKCVCKSLEPEIEGVKLDISNAHY